MIEFNLRMTVFTSILRISFMNVICEKNVAILLYRNCHAFRVLRLYLSLFLLNGFPRFKTEDSACSKYHRKQRQLDDAEPSEQFTGVEQVKKEHESRNDGIGGATRTLISIQGT